MTSPKMTIITVDTITARTPPPRTGSKKTGRDSLTIWFRQRYGPTCGERDTYDVAEKQDDQDPVAALAEETENLGSIPAL
jgi:hypothetical protein